MLRKGRLQVCWLVKDEGTAGAVSSKISGMASLVCVVKERGQVHWVVRGEDKDMEGYERWETAGMLNGERKGMVTTTVVREKGQQAW